jgi:hypothetical protein
MEIPFKKVTFHFSTGGADAVFSWYKSWLSEFKSE